VSTSSTFSTYVFNNYNVGNYVGIIFNGLNAGTTYYYRVRAYNSSGTSGNSGTISVTTLANNISVTVQPSISGRSFTVDGNTYTTAQTFSWVPGNSHTIATTSPQSGGSGIQYVWSSWSDGGAMSHTVAPTVGTTFTANFTTQYYLTEGYGTGGSNVNPGGGWYNSGASFSVSATPASGYSFSSWTGSGSGSYSGSSPSPTITINGPITELANFTTNSSQPCFGGSYVSGGKLETTLSGLSSGKTVIIYSSTDLKNWTPIQTNIVSGSTLTFTNTVNPAVSSLFFRAVVK
jgi:hypothetical protein